MAQVRYEKAPDIERIMLRVMGRFRDRLPHVDTFRVLCVRSRGSTANAYARIWAMPKAWQVALDISAFYVMEVISEKFDALPESEKEKTILHELLHIPRTFSGALLPHVYGKGKLHIDEMVDGYFLRENEEQARNKKIRGGSSPD